jgi:hypothetical protein
MLVLIEELVNVGRRVAEDAFFLARGNLSKGNDMANFDVSYQLGRESIYGSLSLNTGIEYVTYATSLDCTILFISSSFLAFIKRHGVFKGHWGSAELFLSHVHW